MIVHQRRKYTEYPPILLVCDTENNREAFNRKPSYAPNSVNAHAAVSQSKDHEGKEWLSITPGYQRFFPR